MPRVNVQIERLARLARIRITPEESARLTSDIGVMVDYFEQLQSMDTGAAKPTDRADRSESTHPDNPADSLPVDQALANGPEINDGFFIVPKVIG
jgi:aspartyl-tRNA(Asn)/glutamyl-tRNA(Gln) amidotransferase subunit C